MVTAAIALGVVDRLERSDGIITEQNIVILIAIKAIAAAPAEYGVTARAAVCDVVTGTCGDGIVAGTGIDFVVAEASARAKSIR